MSLFGRAISREIPPCPAAVPVLVLAVLIVPLHAAWSGTRTHSPSCTPARQPHCQLRSAAAMTQKTMVAVETIVAEHQLLVSALSLMTAEVAALHCCNTINRWHCPDVPVAHTCAESARGLEHRTTACWR